MSRIFPLKRVVAGQDIQPEDYINPDLQQSFTIGNTMLDGKNVPPEELTTANFAHKAWQKAEHIAFDSLDTILVNLIYKIASCFLSYTIYFISR